MRSGRFWVVLAVVFGVGLGGYVWWREGANERRTDELLNDAEARIEIDFGSTRRGPHNTQSGFRVCGDIDDSYGSKELNLREPSSDAVAAAEPVARSYESDGWTVQRSIISDGGIAFSHLQVDAIRGPDRVMLSFFDGAVRVLRETGECLTRLGFFDRPERNVEVVDVLPTERPPGRSEPAPDR